MDAEMQWATMGSKNAMIELAKEELEILEFQQPNKFQCLKLELKALISDLENHKLLLSSNPISTCSSAATQESSSSKKRKKGESIVGCNGRIERRCKTDAVLKRAQECLHKIQHFKTSLC